MRSINDQIHDSEVIIHYLETELESLKYFRSRNIFEVTENAIQVVGNMLRFEKFKLEKLNRAKEIQSVCQSLGLL